MTNGNEFSNLNDAILKSLEDFPNGATYKQVYENIKERGYYAFESNTPENSVGSALGNFIRASDTRVNRVSKTGGSKNYIYYLTKNEGLVSGNVDGNDGDVLDVQAGDDKSADHPAKQERRRRRGQPEDNNYLERDLHRLLATFLKEDVSTLTIKHEESTQDDKSQIWSHPDIVGIKIYSSNSTETQRLQKTLDGSSTFNLYSYELKREINSDRQLKEAYFQAVSNSSWANYGYLVCFGYAPWLETEMRRLNESFGIGFIHLSANAPRSRIFLRARRNDELDFRTIEKLCGNNQYFRQFIGNINRIATAPDDHFSNAVAGLEAMRKTEERRDFDIPLDSERDIRDWCERKNIPWDETEG